MIFGRQPKTAPTLYHLPTVKKKDTTSPFLPNFYTNTGAEHSILNRKPISPGHKTQEPGPREHRTQRANGKGHTRRPL